MPARVIVSGLAASISPVSLTVIIAIMTGREAKRNSLFFLAGYTLVLAAVGLAAVTFLHGAGPRVKSPVVSGTAETALGALCLIASAAAALKKDRAGKTSELSAGRAFAVGIATILVNFSTWVCYISGLQSIVKEDAGLWSSLLYLALLTLLTVSSLLLPLFILYLFPNRSRIILDRLAAGLEKHGRVIGAAVLLFFGAYLLVKGISALA